MFIHQSITGTRTVECSDWQCGWRRTSNCGIEQLYKICRDWIVDAVLNYNISKCDKMNQKCNITDWILRAWFFFQPQIMRSNIFSKVQTLQCNENFYSFFLHILVLHISIATFINTWRAWHYCCNCFEKKIELFSS